MDDLLRRAGLTLASSAAALLVAAILLGRFTIGVLGFPVVVVVFTAVSMVAKPVTASLMRQHARQAFWAVGLVATWATLLITDLLSRSLQIEGLVTWVLATVIVWGAGMAADAAADALQKDRPSGRKDPASGA